MKKFIFTIVILFTFCVNSFAEVNTHKRLRKVLQFGWPDSMMQMKIAWNGVQDIDAFLNSSNVVWKVGKVIPTAAQIIAKEAEYISFRDVANLKNDAENFVQDKASREAIFILIELIDALVANGTVQPSEFTARVRKEYQDLKAKVAAIK